MPSLGFISLVSRSTESLDFKDNSIPTFPSELPITSSRKNVDSHASHVPLFLILTIICSLLVLSLVAYFTYPCLRHRRLVGEKPGFTLVSFFFRTDANVTRTDDLEEGKDAKHERIPWPVLMVRNRVFPPKSTVFSTQGKDDGLGGEQAIMECGPDSELLESIDDIPHSDNAKETGAEAQLEANQPYDESRSFESLSSAYSTYDGHDNVSSSGIFDVSLRGGDDSMQSSDVISRQLHPSWTLSESREHAQAALDSRRAEMQHGPELFFDIPDSEIRPSKPCNQATILGQLHSESNEAEYCISAKDPRRFCRSSMPSPLVSGSVISEPSTAAIFSADLREYEKIDAERGAACNRAGVFAVSPVLSDTGSSSELLVEVLRRTHRNGSWSEPRDVFSPVMDSVDPFSRSSESQSTFFEPDLSPLFFVPDSVVITGSSSFPTPESSLDSETSSASTEAHVNHEEPKSSKPNVVSSSRKTLPVTLKVSPSRMCTQLPTLREEETEFDVSLLCPVLTATVDTLELGTCTASTMDQTASVAQEGEASQALESGKATRVSLQEDTAHRVTATSQTQRKHLAEMSNYGADVTIREASATSHSKNTSTVPPFSSVPKHSRRRSSSTEISENRSLSTACPKSSAISKSTPISLVKGLFRV